jgi:hypothetical protein
VKCAEYVMENKIYKTDTVMKNRFGLGVSMLGDDKGLKRSEWEEILRENENLCIVRLKDTNVSEVLTASGSYGATTQKTAIFILTAVRTSNPTHR